MCISVFHFYLFIKKRNKENKIAQEVLLRENVNDLTLELAFQKTVAIERSRKEAQNLGTSNTINQMIKIG